MTFRIHPLHTTATHIDYMRDMGPHGYHDWLAQKRSTGRSTALALAYIAKAMDVAHVPVLLKDHPHKNSENSNAKLAFSEYVRSIVVRLGFHSLTVVNRNGDCYLTFGESAC